MRYSKQVRANVLAEMGRRELRQSDVALVLDTSQKNVSRRLHGDVDWKLGELLKLAETWDLPLATILAGADNNPFEPNDDPKVVAA
ncbi:helix-turn-helix domain-containing protein [Garicola koreensis]|uniref:Putative transcriptional regulator n=1 Tax=Garicola koreensis TaxID=1262554 RepID=A0A7W5TSE2_9MICC|nr:helix-turn-helix domain-containing protein [Garicola koreensis]MBB3667782.1 putative transcriptional regulator [Garicola koreensis]